MKQNTFEPCKDHENGHFNWCLLCEIEQLRDSLKNCQEKNDNQREMIEKMREHIEFERSNLDDILAQENPVHKIIASWCK